MSDDPVQGKARRWRWLTVAELLAVAGIVVSVLALLDSHSARTHDEQDRAVAQKQTSAQVDRLALIATVADAGRSLRLVPALTGQVIQSQRIRFPSALGVSPAETTGDPRIEAGWFADDLKKARKAVGEADDSVGDERLPVAIETRFLADGTVHVDEAIYDVGYVFKGHFLGGSSVTLRGLALTERLAGGDPAARLDKSWSARHHNGGK